jgi:hypothetical protein
MPDKLRERFYLDLLRRALPEIPADVPEEPEPPDFLFRTGNGSLGIEFTLFHLSPAPGQRPHQERQSLKDRIVSLAQRLHQEAGGPALYVGVYFNENYAIDKKDTARLAREIAGSVLRAPTPPSIQEPVDIPWGQRPEETIRIHLMESVDGKDKLWHADAGARMRAFHDLPRLRQHAQLTLALVQIEPYRIHMEAGLPVCAPSQNGERVLQLWGRSSPPRYRGGPAAASSQLGALR